MKRLIIISFLFLILTILTIAGYKLVSADKQIIEKKDIITYQESKEKYLTYYNYTLDNPNIILNPYGISPLTALIIFETPDEEETIVTIYGKDKNSTYTNTFEKNKIHFIPVLGLYPDKENIINIKCGKTSKDYKIKTEKIPSDLIITKKNNNTNNLYFISSENYTYAIDNNNEVRWYLTKKYNKKISRLENGNLLLSTDKLLDDKHSTGLVEIDLLGKVYNEFDIKTGYYGSYSETPNSILVLSNKLLEISKKNGLLINSYILNDNYISVDYKNKNIILKNNYKTKEINYETKEEKELLVNNNINETEILLPLYNIKNYKVTKGMKHINNSKTKISKKKILLLNYKKKDNYYKNHNIKLTKESDRLIINGNFSNEEEAYIILDKFLDKKIYNIKNGLNYVNSKGLSGNYSIYIKIDKIIYKTNNYVTF